MRIAAAAVLVSIMLSGEAYAAFAEGEAALNQKDFVTAFALLKPDAEAGNAQAQTYLGRMYRKGQGVPKDPSVAAAWFQKAAAQGEWEASNTLATMYRLGEGVPQDFGEAMRWYKEAAKLGIENAMYRIALMYQAGQGVQASPTEAYKWAYVSAKHGGQPEPARLRDKLAKQLAPAVVGQAQRDGDHFLNDLLAAAATKSQAVPAPQMTNVAAPPTPVSQPSSTMAVAGRVDVKSVYVNPEEPNAVGKILSNNTDESRQKASEFLKGRWAFSGECQTDYDEYHEDSIKQVGTSYNFHNTSPARYAYNGANIVVIRGDDNYVEFEALSDREIRQMVTARGAKITRRKPGDSSGPIISKCDASNTSINTTVQTGPSGKPESPKIEPKTSPSPVTTGVTPSMPLRPLPNKAGFIARFTCSMSDERMMVSNCFDGTLSGGAGSLQIKNSGASRQYSQSDFLNDFQRDVYEISLTDDFEITARANGDSYYKLEVEIYDGSGKRVFQKQTSSYGVIKVRP